MPDAAGRACERERHGAGTLTTRPVDFSGAHLFVNADLGGGELRVEVLDRDGRVIAPFARERVRAGPGDGTRPPCAGRGASLAASPAGRALPLLADARPALCVLGQPVADRRERGYPAAGGPEFQRPDRPPT